MAPFLSLSNDSLVIVFLLPDAVTRISTCLITSSRRTTLYPSILIEQNIEKYLFLFYRIYHACKAHIGSISVT
jgi:hypothetical protein